MTKRTIGPGNLIGRNSARLMRQIVVASALCLVVYYYILSGGGGGGFLRSGPRSPWVTADAGVGRPPREVLDNRSLSEEQCRAHFPGLFREIDDAVAKGPKKADENSGGRVQVAETGDLHDLAARRRFSA